MTPPGKASQPPFEDRDSPCLCPQAVIELLDIAVRYAEASLPESDAADCRLDDAKLDRRPRGLPGWIGSGL